MDTTDIDKICDCVAALKKIKDDIYWTAISSIPTREVIEPYSENFHKHHAKYHDTIYHIMINGMQG